ncbi:MAG: hypothetical protein ACJ8F7_07060, partial [Gemmataceae bacterium]
ESGAWGPPQVRDASFALQAELARQERPRADRAETLVHLGVGTVTAAVQAPESGVLFVGGESGRVVAFEPRVGSVGVVDTLGGPVTALAVTVTGRYILAAHQQGPKLNLLNCYRLSAGGASTVLGDCSFPSGAAILLSPIVAFDLGELLAACRDRHQPTSFALFRGPDLRAGTVQLRVDPTADDWSDTASNPLGPSAELLFSIESNGSVSARLLSFDGGWLSYSAFRPQGGEILLDTSNITIDWTPAAHPESSIGTPLLSWLNGRDGPVEFTGLSAEKALYWLRVQLPPQEFRRERLLATGCPEGYRCAALLRPGMIAGVTASNRVIWLRAAADKLEEWRPPVKLGRTSPAVACFVSAATSELLVVLQNGGLLRVPLPS